MATSSDILLLALLAQGESNVLGFGNWGESANFNFEALEDTIGEKADITLAATNVTLTAAQERALYLNLTGTLSANVEVRTNDRKGFWFVSNGTTGAFTVTFKPTTGTGFTVAQGAVHVVYCTGTAMIDITAGARRISGNLELSSTDAGATQGPNITTYRNSASPAASDVIGGVKFDGNDSAGNQTTYVQLFATITDPTNGSEDGSLTAQVMVAGTPTSVIVVNGTAITISGTLTVTG